MDFSVSRRYGPEYYDYGTPKSHFAKVNFDLDVDFTPVFNWNTKQVFVTVVAEYESKTHVSEKVICSIPRSLKSLWLLFMQDRNSIVLWDHIIESKQDANLTLRNIQNKYAFIDVSRKWR